MPHAPRAVPLSLALPTRRALGALGLAGSLTLVTGCMFSGFTFNEGGGGTGNANGGGGVGNVGGGGSGNTGNTTGGGGTGNMGGGGSGNTGNTASETDCFDGVDNDEDGMPDCADSDCTEIVKCVPNAPVGWEGPVALYDGAPAGDPGCPSEFPSEAFLGNADIVTTGSCSACGCAAPSGQTCDLPNQLSAADAVCSGQPTCTLAAWSLPSAWNGTCYSATFLNNTTTCGPTASGSCTIETGDPCNVALSSPPPVVVGGSCAPSGGVLENVDVSWATLGHACGEPPAVGLGCNASQQCLPKPTNGFLTGLCIYQPGDSACPAGQFTQKHVFHTGFDDQRACSQCACGAPFGSTCQVDITVHSNSTCSAPVLTFQAGTCGDVAGNPLFYGRTATVTQPPTGGQCNVSGGQLTGEVVLEDPITFCCIP